MAHYPAWAWFNKAIGSNGDVRIWHETYLVRVGEFEAAYNNMPRKGLANIGESVPAGVEVAYAAGRLDWESLGTPSED